MPHELITPYGFRVARLKDLCRNWEELLHLALPVHFAKGENLDGMGPETLDFFYIEKGRVQMVYVTMDGRERNTTLFEAGCLCFLAPAVLQKDVRTSSTLICRTEVKAWRFKGSLLQSEDFVREHPRQLLSLARLLASNMLIHSTYTSDMLLETPRRKVCLFLLSLAESQGSNDFNPEMSLQDMARMLGMHRATLSEILAGFKRMGLLGVCTGRRVQLLRPDELRRLLEQFAPEVR